MKTVNWCLFVCTYTKDYSWKPSKCISENGTYLRSIASTSVIVCDEIINATDSVSINVTNTIPKTQVIIGS